MLLGRGEGNKALCANRMKEMKNSALSKCVENLDLFTFISHTQLFRQMAVINFQQKKINSNSVFYTHIEWLKYNFFFNASYKIIIQFSAIPASRQNQP